MPLFKASVLIRAVFSGINSIKYNAVIKVFLKILNAFYSVII